MLIANLELIIFLFFRSIFVRKKDFLFWTRYSIQVMNRIFTTLMIDI